ncbi:hypothetical protein C8J56DRAFT_879962 [Mycena floridula]|nr:hypothetical protein C8J56DRAFT_879962 [Mycena floridula]
MFTLNGGRFQLGPNRHVWYGGCTSQSRINSKNKSYLFIVNRAIRLQSNVSHIYVWDGIEVPPAPRKPTHSNTTPTRAHYATCQTLHLTRSGTGGQCGVCVGRILKVKAVEFSDYEIRHELHNAVLELPKEDIDEFTRIGIKRAESSS